MTLPAFRTVGILHPGAMGVTVAATAKNSGCEVYWASEGRRAQSLHRAQQVGLLDAGTLRDLCQKCELIVSVCPPEFAESLALQVAGLDYRGVYADANAVAPARKLRMAALLAASSIPFVDGGIMGLPPSLDPGVGSREKTILLLSGEHAPQVATCFTGGPVEAEVISTEVGKASAVKMCFAALAKGTTALSVAVLGTASHFGVVDDLKRQWIRRGSRLTQIEGEISRAAPKAWRFAPEMLEIAATFEAAGEPPEFHRAAAAIFERLRDFKDAEGVTLDEVIAKMDEVMDKMDEVLAKKNDGVIAKMR